MTEHDIQQLLERVKQAEEKAAQAEAALIAAKTRRGPVKELTISERLEKSQYFAGGYLLAGGVESDELTSTLQVLALIQDRAAGKVSLLSGGNIRQASNRACQVVAGYLARQSDGGSAIEKWHGMIAAARAIKAAGTGDDAVPEDVQERAWVAYQEQPEQEQPEQPEQEQPEQEQPEQEQPEQEQDAPKKKGKK